MLMQELIDRISPCIRKDCNYSNMDRIKMECKWDEEQGKWILPKLTIERTALPVSGRNQFSLSRGIRFPTMWYVRPAKPQISLPNAQSDQSLC